MHNIRYVIPIVAAMSAILLSGCEQDLNLDKYKNPEIDNLLVVNSILNPDSVIKVSVTDPYFFTSPHTTFAPVTTLDVQVTDESGKWHSLIYDEDSKLYISSIKPTAGETLNMQISRDGDVISCCDSIPDKVVIEEVTASGDGPMHIYWDNDYRFTYKITFQDTPGRENYYFLKIENDALNHDFSQMGQVDYTTDYVFLVLAGMINRNMQGWKPDGVFGYPFSDKGIDGQRYTITVSEVLQMPLVGMIKQLPRKVNLYSISKAYFEYMLSILSMDYEESSLKGDLLSLGLMEPTKVYSNINGGTGLMGSYNLSTKKVDLLQLSGGWPTSSGNASNQ